MRKIHVPPKHFDKVCRVCLLEYSPLISLAEISLTHNLQLNGKVENVSLISIFERFCGVKVTPDDKKPQKICEFCIDMSSKAFNYFQLFIYSDTLLTRTPRKQTLEQSKSKSNTKQNKSKDKSTSSHVKSKNKPVIAGHLATNDRVTSEIHGFDDTMVPDDTEDLDCAEDYENIAVAQDTAVFKDAVVLDGTVGLDGTIYFKDQVAANEAEVIENPKIPNDAAVKTEIISEEDIPSTPCVEHIKIEVKEEIPSEVPIPRPIQKTRKRWRTPTTEMGLRLDSLQKDALKILMRVQNKYNLKDPKLPKIKQSLGPVGFINMNDIFKCTFCIKTLNGMDKVMEHMDDEHESLTKCILCPLTFRTRARLRYHVATHSPNSLICRTCQLLFETKEEFDQHFDLLDHTNIKKCPKCEKTYKAPSMLRKHMEAVHLKKYKFQCRHCGKMFIYRENMSRHERNTHGSRKFLCQVCGKNVSTNHMLKVHMQRIHKIPQGVIIKKYPIKKKDTTNRKPRVQEPPQYKCKFCDREFHAASQFYQHSESHPEFDEYECLICHNVLKTKKEYDAHYETHKTFKCRNHSCPKMFTTNAGSLAHTYTHNKRFKCGTCFNSYGSNQALKDHMNVHTGEKPYICEECGQGFKQSQHLKVHITVQHQGQGKPWKCHLCDKAFSFSSMLTVHMRSHTGHKPFTCLYCDKIFRDTTGRHKHIKKEHPEKMEEFLVYREQYQEHEKRQIREQSPKTE